MPRLWSTVLPALLAFCTAGALGQSYPTRAIKLVVPSSPGGGTDIVARILGQKLSEQLGQQFVVENRAGAGTVIGNDAVAKSAPDGYTLLMGLSTLAINPSMYAKLPYDALRDFAPISQSVSACNILILHPSVPAKTVTELIALARGNRAALRSAPPAWARIRTCRENCSSRSPALTWCTCRSKARGKASSVSWRVRSRQTFRACPLLCLTSKRGGCAALASPRSSGWRCCPMCRALPKRACPATRRRSGSGCSRRRERRALSSTGCTRSRHARCAVRI